jgi:hypothetical protein
MNFQRRYRVYWREETRRPTPFAPAGTVIDSGSRPIWARDPKDAVGLVSTSARIQVSAITEEDEDGQE